MACPGGCINGGGQPASFRSESRAERRQTLDEARRVTPIHRPEDNPYLQRIYEKLLGGRPGSPEAHGLLHTAYRSRRRIEHDGISLTETGGKPLLDINVCVGTGCFLRGAREILSEITDRFVSAGRDDRIALRATFCTENCSHGPTVTVGDTVLRHATADTVFRTVEAALELPAAVTG